MHLFHEESVLVPPTLQLVINGGQLRPYARPGIDCRGNFLRSSRLSRAMLARRSWTGMLFRNASGFASSASIGAASPGLAA